MLKNCTSVKHSKPREPLSIGGLEPRNRAFLAPMSGVTDVPFRRLVWQFGAGFVVSEMVASEALTTGQEEMRLKAESAGLPLHVVQLAGRQPRWMAEATRLAEGSGADIIDINMGCPAKRVTTGYSGSALMRDLDHAMTLLDAVLEAASVPVTLKMRLGWDETSINAPELAERAERAGVKMITVHGRTRNQFYKGQADWTKIAAVRDRISVPLVVNGDVGSVSSAREAMSICGADAVMIGRAAYGAPWLPGQIGGVLDGLPVVERPHGAAFAGMVAQHYEDMISFYGVDYGIRNARKHLDWYCAHLPSGMDFSIARRAMMTSKDPTKVLAIIADLFPAVPAETKSETMAA